MRMDKLTQRAQEALVEAQEKAQSYNNPQIDPEHLLSALIEQADGVVPQIIQKLNVSLRPVQQQVEAALQNKPKAYGGGMQVEMSNALQNVLNQAQAQADRMKDEYVSTEHLFLALAESKSGAVAGL